MSSDTPTPEFVGALAQLLELELASSPPAVRAEVARLLAEVARLTPDTPGVVSDHVRSRFAEASAAALAGEGGCIGAGCIPAHQACEVLDAYDDARADVERLTEDETERVQDARHAMRLARIDRGVAVAELERRAHEHSQEVLGLQSNAAGVKVQHDARVERLTREVSAHKSTIGKLRRDLCQAWGRDDCGQRFPGQAARDRAARAVAKRQGWDCYPEDSTTVEPTLHDCIGMAEALVEGGGESPI